MGWFGASKPEEKPDPVTRQSRQKCWESRDAYYACLDGAGVVTPGEEGNACAATKGGFELNCAKSWIDYFNKRRVLAEQQKGMLAQANTQASAVRRS